MELISLGQEMLQSIAEHAASYRYGQSLLKQLDRALWVVEKCARWAVPPPLDQDERPQPELVRPLPWVFFLMMLITLRVTRESISLFNLVMGKPPVRSADVVMFIQSKRRYLRTLKYQGNRMMRARSSTQGQAQHPWYKGVSSLFEFTMCFRRQSYNYGNNNTTEITNNDEVVVVEGSKRGGQEQAVAPVSSGETTMERLIEKIMLDLDAESDEDSNYTLTNATTTKSEGSDLTESDQDTLCYNQSVSKTNNSEISQTNGDDTIRFSPDKNKNSSSTPEKKNSICSNNSEDSVPENERNVDSNNASPEKSEPKAQAKSELEENHNEETPDENSTKEQDLTQEESALTPKNDRKILSPKQESENFIKNEASRARTPKKENKIANGRTVKSVPSKKKGTQHVRRESKEPTPPTVLNSNNSF